MWQPAGAVLMEAGNRDVEPGEQPVVQGRESSVIASAKRARQLIAGEEAYVPSAGRKPLSVAIEELYKSYVKILPEEEGEDEAE